jgi:hypothetical protein
MCPLAGSSSDRVVANAMAQRTPKTADRASGIGRGGVAQPHMEDVLSRGVAMIVSFDAGFVLVLW